MVLYFDISDPMSNARLQREKLAAMQHLLPKDYFQGIRSQDLYLADNVIVFLRHNRNELNRRNFESKPHHRHVLIVNLQTAGSISIDGSVFHLKPNEAFLIAPFQFHFYMDVLDSKLSWLFVTFETPNSNPFASFANTPIALSEELTEDAVNIARYYDQRNNSKLHGNANQLILATSTFLNRLQNRAQSSSPSLPQPITSSKSANHLVHRVNKLLHERLAEGISIQELGTRLNISESHLRKRFKLQTSLSLGSYIVHYKLNRAVKLLVHSENSLTMIAIECGYESLAAFSRSFKNALSVTPSQYRKHGFNKTDPLHATYL